MDEALFSQARGISPIRLKSRLENIDVLKFYYNTFNVSVLNFPTESRIYRHNAIGCPTLKISLQPELLRNL